MSHEITWLLANKCINDSSNVCLIQNDRSPQHYPHVQNRYAPCFQPLDIAVIGTSLTSQHGILETKWQTALFCSHRKEKQIIMQSQKKKSNQPPIHLKLAKLIGYKLCVFACWMRIWKSKKANIL